MKKSILIVEDDTDIRQALMDVLQDEGYSVQTAVNGKQGIELLKNSEQLPSLVILDLMMPVMDGYGFREEQLKDTRLLSIPTVLFSADGQLDQKARKAGFNEFMKKPIDLSELFSYVEKYCDT